MLDMYSLFNAYLYIIIFLAEIMQVLYSQVSKKRFTVNNILLLTILYY